jgi:hypothetical protein
MHRFEVCWTAAFLIALLAPIAGAVVGFLTYPSILNVEALLKSATQTTDENGKFEVEMLDF